MRPLNTNPNVDNSDLSNYPGGRIKNNTGSGTGTPVNERVYGDIHQMIAKLMRLYNITPNNFPDNETNGFQNVDALRALASKNDFVLPLSVSSGILSVPIKLGYMQDNEQVVCRASIDYTSETQIKGSDVTTFTLSVQGSFLQNEYVRLIKTSAGVTLVRLADNVSLDEMVSYFNYLKKATLLEEYAGAIDTSATTPLSNLAAFLRRVNGVDSTDYLADSTQNGLYSIAHFNIVSNLRIPSNIGWFSGLNIGATSGTLTVSGDVVSAECMVVGDSRGVLVTLANATPNINYKVRCDVESNATSVINDLNAGCPMIRKISTTQFYFVIGEFSPATQNLKVYIETIQS